MSKYEFTPETMTVNGKTFPIDFSIGYNAVTVFVNMGEDVQPERIRFDKKHPDYASVLSAAEARAAAWKEERKKKLEECTETISETVEVVAEAVQETAAEEAAEERTETISETVEAVADTITEAVAEIVAEETVEAEPERPTVEELNAGKAARGPVPEKVFAGEAISGKGWAIVFDTEANRTRVIISEKIKEIAVPIIEAAGFYHSKITESWNKKLTHRAHRAALALADDLRAALA